MALFHYKKETRLEVLQKATFLVEMEEAQPLPEARINWIDGVWALVSS